MLSLLHLVAPLLVADSPQLVALPTDVGGSARGAAAAAFDPAAVGRVDGPELQLRQRSGVTTEGLGAVGLYGVAPLFAGLSVNGGYEWGGQPLQAARATYGLAWGSERFWVGLDVRALRPGARGSSVHILDLGIFAEPTPWFTVSAGLDALNEPDTPDAHLPRAGRVGVALRPWAGAPYVTVAGDTRVTAGYQASWTWVDTRALLDVAPLEGLHVMASYGRHGGVNEVWAGLSIEILGAGLWGAVRADNGAGTSLSNSALALTLKMRPTESLVRSWGRTVEIPLEGELEPAPSESLLGGGKTISTVVLDLARLADAADVDVVRLPIGPLRVGLGTVDELRAAIRTLRARGKRVVTELHAADDKTYMVAAAADSVEIDPLAVLRLDGFAVTRHYFADTLGKVGVRFDAVGVGKYKSGPDPLTRNTMRPEDREVEGEILAGAQATLVEALRDDRKLGPEAIAQVFDTGLFGAREAVAAGLVDGLTLPDDPNAVPPRRHPGEPVAATQNPSRRWSGKPAIAVVPVVGTIVPVSADNPLPGATADAKVIGGWLEAARSDPTVRGVVLRIDSPGGDVYASELIWRGVKRLVAEKPVVVSMSNVAASGGYYAAAPASLILAEPNTVTGSIGIFTFKPDVHGLLERLGVVSETLKSTERADWESFEKPLGEADRARVTHSLEDLYTAFVARVASGRHLPEARVRELAEGRVYTGLRARELGLVDDIGGLADAVAQARTLARVARETEVEIRVPDRAFGLPALVGRLAQVREPWDAVRDTLDHASHAWRERPLALMPWHYEVGP